MTASHYRHPFMVLPQPRNQVRHPQSLRPENKCHVVSASEHHTTMFDAEFVPHAGMPQRQSLRNASRFSYGRHGSHSTPSAFGCNMVNSVFMSPLLRCVKGQQERPSSQNVYSRSNQATESPTVFTEKVLIWEVRETDVLCGRGSGNGHRHKGNARFRELIAAQSSYYRTLTKKQKLNLATQIVQLVRRSGHFLARDSKTGGWYDIGYPRSIEKASQSLREQSAIPDKTCEANQMDESASQNLSTTSPTCSETTTKWNNQSTTVRSTNATPKLIIPPTLLNVYDCTPKNFDVARSFSHDTSQSLTRTPDSHGTERRSCSSLPPVVTPRPQPQIHLKEERDVPSTHRMKEGEQFFLQRPEQVWKKPRIFDMAIASPEMALRRQGSLFDSNSDIGSSSMSSLSSCEDVIVESKLSLEDRIIRAPHGANERELVPPSQVQCSRQQSYAAFDTDQDGLVALSTAAFLHLEDEL